MGITSKEFKEAGERMDALRAKTPFATEAHYDRKSKSVIIKLSNGLGIFFSPEDAQGLEGATAGGWPTSSRPNTKLGAPHLDSEMWV